jgi:hypothetical protein
VGREKNKRFAYEKPIYLSKAKLSAFASFVLWGFYRRQGMGFQDFLK